MQPARPTRILIVDDSAVMRSLLRSVVATDPALEVCGTAADGASALTALTRLRPDLMLLDVEMPVMNGLSMLRALRARGSRMPVIMCSSLTRQGAAVTIEALACGASDYVAKPSGQLDRDSAMSSMSAELLAKIHALTEQQRGAVARPIAVAAPWKDNLPASDCRSRVVAIGVSTGGPAALEVMLPQLPEDFALPVLIVQHMPEVFTRPLADRLSGRCRLPVREAAEGEVVHPGTIYLARGNWHLEVLASARGRTSAALQPTLHLTQGPLEHHCRPAVDVLLRSVAGVYGAGAMVLVLTGMGVDGTAGCRAIREAGGLVLAQDRASSAVWGMPGSVVNAGLAHRVIPIAAMARDVLRLARPDHDAAPALRKRVG